MQRQTVNIGGRIVGDGHPSFIVAEIGQNHQGDVYHALRLVAAAQESGADAVKLQKRDLESDMTPALYQEPYDEANSFGKTYGAHRAALELPISDVRHLIERIHYNEWAIRLFGTVCDCKSLEQLEPLGLPCYKIASRDLDNLPLIDEVAKTGRPLILSTGMASWDQIDHAVEAVKYYHNDIIICQCTSQYPCDLSAVNLRALQTIRDRYGCLVGFSDHTAGHRLAAVAIGMGASYIEKHITLSRNQKGRDHAVSLEVGRDIATNYFSKMVQQIRDTERALGNGDKQGMACNHEARVRLGRSLTTTRCIAMGECIKLSDLCLKSPGTGIPYSELGTVLGERVACEVPEDTTLTRLYLDQRTNATKTAMPL